MCILCTLQLDRTEWLIYRFSSDFVKVVTSEYNIIVKVIGINELNYCRLLK